MLCEISPDQDGTGHPSFLKALVLAVGFAATGPPGKSPKLLLMNRHWQEVPEHFLTLQH